MSQPNIEQLKHELEVIKKVLMDSTEEHVHLIFSARSVDNITNKRAQDKKNETIAQIEHMLEGLDANVENIDIFIKTTNKWLDNFNILCLEHAITKEFITYVENKEIVAEENQHTPQYSVSMPNLCLTRITPKMLQSLFSRFQDGPFAQHFTNNNQIEAIMHLPSNHIMSMVQPILDFWQQNLTKLDLSNNGLNQIPAFLEQLPNLELLGFFQNPLEKGNEPRHLPRLKQLLMDIDRMQNLPIGLKRFDTRSLMVPKFVVTPEILLGYCLLVSPALYMTGNTNALQSLIIGAALVILARACYENGFYRQKEVNLNNLTSLAASFVAYCDGELTEQKEEFAKMLQLPENKNALLSGYNGRAGNKFLPSFSSNQRAYQLGQQIKEHAELDPDIATSFERLKLN